MTNPPIDRRQFVGMTAASLLIPKVHLIGSAGPHDRELTGKVICGYQGWFNAKGDGMGLSFRHYQGSKGLFEPGNCSIDFWPDVSELAPDERYDTPFKHKDGRIAQVFSSANAKTVGRHHQWMKEYGIDGVALQRFGRSLKQERFRRMRDRVLDQTRKAAAVNGRLWMNMYDLSGMRRGEPQVQVSKDWSELFNQGITQDKTYMQHQGKPVVAIWGVGFNDNRNYTLQDCSELIDRVAMGGRCSVMLGIPYYWLKQERDAVGDRRLHDVYRKADILSPWSVGRFADLETALKRGESNLIPDLDWCNTHQKKYLPVVFPGFSWHNLEQARGRKSKLNKIPRQNGAFLWAQAEAARMAGVDSLYVAMFDELDEATAVFKCTNDPPVCSSPFLTYEGMPSDHYLWLTGKLAQRLRQGDHLPFETFPKRS